MSNSEAANSKLIGRPGSRWNLLTPALILDLDALEANIAAMADWAKAGGLHCVPMVSPTNHPTSPGARQPLAPLACVAPR